MQKLKCSIRSCSTTDPTHFKADDYSSFVPKYGIMYFGNKDNLSSLKYICPKNKTYQKLEDLVPYSVLEFQRYYPRLPIKGVICTKKCYKKMCDVFTIVDTKLSNYFIICQFCLEKKNIIGHFLFSPPEISYNKEKKTFEYLGDDSLEIYIPNNKLDKDNIYKIIEIFGGKIIKDRSNYTMCLDCVCKNCEFFNVKPKYDKSYLYPINLKTYLEMKTKI